MARLPHITKKDQVDPKDHAVVDAILASRGAIQGPFTMLLHNPDVAEGVESLGAYVRFKGELDMKVRVVAAMTVGRELDVEYVWGAQTSGARKLEVPESSINAIRSRQYKSLPPEDAQIAGFTEQLINKHRVDSATFEAVRKRLGDRGLIQLTGTIGYYCMLSMTANACELEAGEGQEVLK
jgi:4-carboxymuconolactone decarboxylase